MKSFNKIIVLSLIVLFAMQSGFAQKSIKSTKQQTGFLYTQVNLNGGWLLNDNQGFRFSEMSPNSNINATYRSKNQRLLQRGYTNWLALGGYKASFALVYKNDPAAPKVGLQMRDLWLQINTKWDRTKLRIGHFALPYGHAPKMDIDNSFLPALGGQDLGFNRDFGVLFRTRFSQDLDIEVAATLGGAVPSTLMTYSMDQPDAENPQDALSYADFNYQGNWLATARIGNPTFNKNEWGLFAAIGKVSKTAAVGEQSHIYRLGADWTLKHKETLRLTNQVVGGYSHTESGLRGFSLYQKSELDYFLMRTFVLSVSNNLQFQDYAAEGSFTGRAVASISYAFNPHTRLKLNAYTQYNLKDAGQTPGLFLQLVTGFGKRA